MTAYSLDLRERVVAACDNGATEKEAAVRFGVSEDTVQRYKRQRRERGTLVPKCQTALGVGSPEHLVMEVEGVTAVVKADYIVISVPSPIYIKL